MKKSRRKCRNIFLAWIMVTALFCGGFSGYSMASADSGQEAGNPEQTEPVISDTPTETGVPENISGPEGNSVSETQAPASETAAPTPIPDSEPAPFRIMFTSDIHGQVTTEDYESGRNNYTTGGYSKTASLIKQARNELAQNNSVLFDLGDNLYDYTTDFIYDYDISAEQPVFTALSKMNYDAVTLGNHEFEYTLEYLKNQLDRAGLTEKVVLSNVWDAVTKEHVWAENKILTKSIVTASGQEIEVKVGLIGETPPKLSTKKTNFTGILDTEDIIENVKKEAALLKEQGADIIVVLGHTGIGAETPEKKSDSTGYALTKLENVDVVLCGHKHRDFPLKGRTTIYDYLPGIDPETKLVNGKPLVQVQNRGASLGIVDLTLAIRNGKIQVLGKQTEVREVNESTPVDPEINACIGTWSKLFQSDCSEIVCDISDKADIQNYFGTVEDTDAIQLLNNMKISCALLQKGNTLKAYKNLPVVAASTYFRSGLEDDNDYLDIRDYFKKVNIYNIVKYKTKLVLYQMSGAQLKEWMEWSASNYEEPGKNVLFDPEGTSVNTASREEFSKTINQRTFSYNKPFQYLLNKTCLNNWNNLYFFDGVNYTIDTTIAPRYDANGNQINDTNRIISLTRNGVEIHPEDQFLVISDTLPTNQLFSTMKPKSLMKYSSAKYRDFVEDYLRQRSHIGGLQSIVDHNWHLKCSDAFYYVLKSSVNAERLLAAKPWISETIGKVENLAYYLADFSKLVTEDYTAPSINTTVMNRQATNKDVEVSVQATDESGIWYMKYVSGKYMEDSFIWDTEAATPLTDGSSFLCKKNGVYTILAVDYRGNKRIEFVEISNINQGVLGAPVVDSFSNRKTKLTGTAEPNATVYFWLENGKTYKAKVKKTGKFSCKIPAQKAGTTIYAYAADSEGRASARTMISVKRTGPNQPTLNGITTATKKVSGAIGDTYAYPILFVGESDVYVENEHVKKLFQQSELYNDIYNVFLSPINMDEKGNFSLTLQDYVPAETLVELRTLDVVSRASLGASRECELKAPLKPVSVSDVTNLSKTINIYCVQTCDQAVVVIGNEKYTEESCSYHDEKSLYYYSVSIPRTDSTRSMTVYLQNAKGLSPKITIRPKEKVPNLPKVNSVKAGKTKITGKVDLVGPTPEPGASDVKIKKIVKEKVKVKKTIKGKTKVITKTKKKKVVITIPAKVISTETNVYFYVNKKKYRADITSKGKFTVTLKKPLAKGDKIICQAMNLEGSSLKYQKTV